MSTWLELMGADERPLLVLVAVSFGIVLISIAPGSAIAAATAIAGLANRGRRGDAQPAPWDLGDPPLWPMDLPSAGEIDPSRRRPAPLEHESDGLIVAMTPRESSPHPGRKPLGTGLGMPVAP